MIKKEKATPTVIFLHVLFLNKWSVNHQVWDNNGIDQYFSSEYTHQVSNIWQNQLAVQKSYK